MDYAFIGGGNMGRAMAGALIKKGVCAGDAVLVVEPEAKGRQACTALGCRVANVAGPELSQAAVVVLAVKPQVSAEVLAQLKPHLTPSQVVVSIMAGVTLASLRTVLGDVPLVRVMPNTPAQVGLGMSVYHAAVGVSTMQRQLVARMLDASGASLEVDSEDGIDAATAISGSGPAYVFYFAEHCMAAAQDLGFSEEQATLLVRQTLLGATHLWESAGLPPATLRTQVTSKGGTTAAALAHFELQEVGPRLQGGLQQAYKRAKELAQGV